MDGLNEYGAGLRGLVTKGRNPDKWLDFRSFQVFEEATIYAALQFFARSPTPAIGVTQVRLALGP